MSDATLGSSSSSPRGDPDPTAAPPAVRLRTRLGIATLVAILVALHVVAHERFFPGRGYDLDQSWAGMRALAHHQNPYAVIGPQGPGFVWPWNLYYPLPTLLFMAPLAWMSLAAARVVFVAGSAGWLAFAASRDDLWRLVLLASGPFFAAVVLGTWEPALVAAALTPGAAMLYLAKPNEGLALALGTHLPPRRIVVAGFAAAALVLVLSVAGWPHWVQDWHTAVASAFHFDAPILLPGGFLIAAALIRWRRPEARMLVALACVPQTLYSYAALPLFLIPRTRREFLLLAALSYMPIAVEYRGLALHLFGAQLHQIGTAIVWSMYLPCVVMVLRRRA
jgi:hypothetical protein